MLLVQLKSYIFGKKSGKIFIISWKRKVFLSYITVIILWPFRLMQYPWTGSHCPRGPPKPLPLVFSPTPSKDSSWTAESWVQSSRRRTQEATSTSEKMFRLNNSKKRRRRKKSNIKQQKWISSKTEHWKSKTNNIGRWGEEKWRSLLRECSLWCDDPLLLPYFSSVKTAVNIIHALALSNTGMEGPHSKTDPCKRNGKSKLAFKRIVTLQ